MSTNYEDELWAYIVWACYAWANENTATTKLNEAESLASAARRSKKM